MNLDPGGETIVILTPDVEAQQIVQWDAIFRRPWQARSDLQPLGMLVEHGIYNVD